MRAKAAALKSIKKALNRHGSTKVIITGGLLSHAAAMKEIGNVEKREVGRWVNNRAENSHPPSRRRERATARFRRMHTLHKSAPCRALPQTFRIETPLTDREQFKAYRSAALAECWTLAA